jgi:hypothetical protein
VNVDDLLGGDDASGDGDASGEEEEIDALLGL